MGAGGTSDVVGRAREQFPSGIIPPSFCQSPKAGTPTFKVVQSSFSSGTNCTAIEIGVICRNVWSCNVMDT